MHLHGVMLLVLRTAHLGFLYADDMEAKASQCMGLSWTRVVGGNMDDLIGDETRTLLMRSDG